MSKKEGTHQLTAPQQAIEKQSPLSLQYSHPREHQLLVQSSSAHVTPKRKTERVLSAPGTAAAAHTRVSSGVSSVSSAQILPQSQHVQPSGAALGPGRRQAPHQPAAAAPPGSRMMKASGTRAGSGASSVPSTPCSSTAHGRETSMLGSRRGPEMSSIPEKIELNLLSIPAPRRTSPVAGWDVSAMKGRSSPRARDDVAAYSADNSAFQHDGRPRTVENASRVEMIESSSIGAATSSSNTNLPTERHTVVVPTATTSLSLVGTNSSPDRKVSVSSGVGFQSSPDAKTKLHVVTESLSASPACSPSGEHASVSGFPSVSPKHSSPPCQESAASHCSEVDFKAADKTSPVSEKSALLESPKRKGDEKVVNVILRNDTKEHRIKLVSQGSASRTSVSTTEGASSPGKKSITSETSLSPFEETFLEPEANPIRPLSLQSNITLHIKPEAIYSGVPRPTHTALQMEFESLGSPRKTVASVRNSPQAAVPPECESRNVCIDIGENSPLKKVGSKPGKKATSFLTELLSQSSSRRSSKASTSLMKFWGGSKLKNKKQEFGSTVAMAGSNSSNSDSTASELSENSSLNKGLLEYNLLKSEHKPLPRSGLCNEHHDASGAQNEQFPSTRHDSNSSSLGYGESSSLLASAEPNASSSLWLSSKLPWRSGTLTARASQANPPISGQASHAREPDLVVPDAEQDDDEAWFDSVTKLNEQWFKPGAMTSLPGNEIHLLKDTLAMASTDTPVGKSDVATLRGVALFDGLGIGDGQGTLSSGPHNSVPSDFLNFKAIQLGSNNSYGSLNTPMSKTASTYKAFRMTSGQSQNKSSSELSNLPGSGPQSALGGTYRNPLASCMSTKHELATGNSGSGPTFSNRNNLRKQLHMRAGLLRPQLQRKSHTNLLKTNIDDAGAVKEIEAGLLRLMEQFQAGHLTAFGHDSRLRQMEAIREQQESLAKLHQEVGGSQDLYQPLSMEALRINEENMSTLMGKLACLSVAIEKLECSTAPDRKSSQADQRGNVKSPSHLKADKSSEGILESEVAAGEEKEEVVGSSEDGLDGVVLRKKGASAMLQKSMSLGKNPCGAGDIEMSRMKQKSSVARSSSQKHYDRKSGFDAISTGQEDELSSGKDVETPVRSASAVALESHERLPGVVQDDTTQHRHGQHHHRHHRHSQDDQKHTRKKSNKESVAKTGTTSVADQQSSSKTDCGVDGTEMRHFGSHDRCDRSLKHKLHDGAPRSATAVPQVSYIDAELVPTQKQPPALPARPARPLPSPVPPSKQLSSLNQGQSSSPGPPSLSDSKRRPPSLSDSKQGSHSLFVSKPENLSPITKPESSPLPGTHKVLVPASKHNPSSQPLLTSAKDSSAISYRSTAPVVPTTTSRSQTSMPSQSKGISLLTSTYPYPHSRTVQAGPILPGDAPNQMSYMRHQTAPILPGYSSTTRCSTSTPPVATAPSLYTQTRSSYNSTSYSPHIQGPSISSSVSSSRSQTPMSFAIPSSRAQTVSSLSSRIQSHSPAPTHSALSCSGNTFGAMESSAAPAMSRAADRSSKKVSTEKTSLISGNPQR